MLDSKKDTIRKLDPHFLSHEDDTNQVMVENDFQNEVDNRVLEEQYLKNEEGKKFSSPLCFSLGILVSDFHPNL